jgi:hypothetical protein
MFFVLPVRWQKQLTLNLHQQSASNEEGNESKPVLGRSLEEAVAAARDYLRRAMTSSLATGGRRFINHFP